MKISISMIALNEEDFIARALSSCGFADEIVVVDGGSIDSTLAILQADPRVKTICHPWEGHFGRQRQIALQHCSGDWVIRLDADEAFSLAFEKEIHSLLQRTPDEIQAYRIRQCNLVGDESYYSRSSDMFESTPRIWRRCEAIKWQDAVHESLIGFSGKIIEWDAYVVHYGFLNRARFMEKARNYAKIPGSLVERSENLVFRDYDFQPVPERAQPGSHVPPFLLPERCSGKPRIAVVRGPHLDPLEIQALALLQEIFDISIYATVRPSAGLEGSAPPVFCLPEDPKVVTAMAGLEYALFDTDIVYVPEVFWPYSYQAIIASKKFGKTVVSRHRDVVPFAQEENQALKKLKHAGRELVDLFIAESPEAKDALLAEGVLREKIAVFATSIEPITLQSDDPDKGRAPSRISMETYVREMGRLFKSVYK